MRIGQINIISFRIYLLFINGLPDRPLVVQLHLDGPKSSANCRQMTVNLGTSSFGRRKGGTGLPCAPVGQLGP
jgi:hypothetical protein